MEETKEHDKNHRCRHGKRLWWNYGDGKPQHMGDMGFSMEICRYPDEPSEA